MKRVVFETLENIIGVPFVALETETSSVCLANSEELRAEFRLQFTIYDVVNYVYGILETIPDNDAIASLVISYPLDAIFFWKYSSKGKKNRLKNTIEALEFMEISELNWQHKTV